MGDVHPTAVIEKGAELGEGVVVGAYAIIERGARIGARTHVMHHGVVCANARLGEDNTVFPFAVIGARAQVRKRSEKDGGIAIGAHNVFREHVTVHSGTETTTRIGDHNLFMVGCHAAHDVVIGSHCIVANSVALAGHVAIADHVVFGGLAGVAQFVKIGEGAFVAAGAMVEHDVPPFVIVQGDRARVRALNVVGLRRMGVPDESIKELRRVFRAVWISKKPIESNDEYARRLLSGRTR
jgi:UDP-N-acetylglucosamine acyltransferase